MTAPRHTFPFLGQSRVVTVSATSLALRLCLHRLSLSLVLSLYCPGRPNRSRLRNDRFPDTAWLSLLLASFLTRVRKATNSKQISACISNVSLVLHVGNHRFVRTFFSSVRRLSARRSLVDKPDTNAWNDRSIPKGEIAIKRVDFYCLIGT